MNRRESIFAMFLGVCELRTKLPEKKIGIISDGPYRTVNLMPAECWKGVPVIHMDNATPADIGEFNEYLKGLKRYMVISGQCAVSFE